MADKIITLEGIPEWVTITENKRGDQYAEVPVEMYRPNFSPKILGDVLIKLDELGFGDMNFTYDSGYYDSIDDPRLELTKYKNK